ncbi:MAG: hypothetical protein KDC18_15505 [Alphaproteobacteria bacterium]|nr:hypothetical protein [Alphaproteobacteria bacterium]MCB9930861.1 hypothetical protein [Alphaproteobacteria bacterium]
MPQNEGLKDIPQEKLGEVVQDLADFSGATRIICVKQPNGQWRVINQRFD